MMMLLAAGLFVRTLSSLRSIELGFNHESVLLFRMNARQVGHRDPEILAFYADTQKRFRAIPGVDDATFTHHPLVGSVTWSSRAEPVGREPRPDVDTHILLTGPDFFTAQQIPLRLGRAFDDRDRAGSRRGGERGLCEDVFREEQSIGPALHLRPPLQDRDLEIVGVVGNAR